MLVNEIVRSWKDEDYRLSLNSEELALMPGNPAGLIELTDEELVGVDGGSTPICFFSAITVVSVIAGSVASIAVSVIVSEITAHVCPQ